MIKTANLARTAVFIGSISAVLSCLACVPAGRSAGSFSEQRLVIVPTVFKDWKVVLNLFC